MKTKIITIIPACCGSKGIPRKNSRLSAEKTEDSLRKRAGCMHRGHCKTMFILGEGINININKNTDRGDDK